MDSWLNINSAKLHNKHLVDDLDTLNCNSDQIIIMSNYEAKRNPRAGTTSTFNNKILALIGAIAMAVGTAGMVIIGLQIDRIIENQQLGSQPGNGFWLQMGDYVFMFTMIGGFVLVLYGLISLQSIRTEERESKIYRQPRQEFTEAA
ncbi:MAG: hypothetical protein ACRD5H_00835 [Nitrososphaerales archaeon]